MKNSRNGLLISALSVLVVTALAPSGTHAAADSGEARDDRAAIRERIDRWRHMFSATGRGERFTLDGYEDLYADDALLVFDSYAPDWAQTQLVGLDEYRRVWERDMNETFPGWTITRLDVLRIDVADGGEMAWSAINFWGQGRQSDGEVYRGSQHGTHVWKKIDGAWRIVHEHLTGPITTAGVEHAEPPELPPSGNTVEPKPSASTIRDLQTWRRRLDAYFASWSFYDPHFTEADFLDAKAMYTDDPHAIFYDPLPPLKGYRGWDDFQRVITHVWHEAGIVFGDIRYDGDLRVYPLADDLVYTTCLARADLGFEGGRTSALIQRGTQVWHRRPDGRWVVVHEHFSAPAAGEPYRLSKPDEPFQDVQPDPEFTALMQRFAAIWTTDDGWVDWDAADAMYADDPDRVHFVPWRPRKGYVGFDAFREGVQRTVFDRVLSLEMTIGPDVEATRRGDVAWSTNTAYLRITFKDGREVQADGRQTMIWQRREGNWQILHEHYSLPAVPTSAADRPTSTEH